MKKKILVWPANTEIGLEIGHAFKGQTHFDVYGASSGPGPADFVFDSHFTVAPNVNDQDAGEWLTETCKALGIDFVYPSHDQATVVCANINVPYIGSPPETVRMCRSKRATYEAVNVKLAGVVPTAYPAGPDLPYFVKPNVGQGSSGGYKTDNPLTNIFNSNPRTVICDYLPGPEYTIDCFTDRHGFLHCVLPRLRKRISNGICIESEPSQIDFWEQARAISDAFKMRGAWFFQMKEGKDGVPTLLEIATRPAGSSGFNRANGVNLPLLAAYDACGIDVELIDQDICAVAYRSLQTHYSVDLEFDTVFVDWDDTIMCGEWFNPEMVALMIKFRREKDIVILTRSKLGPPPIIADAEDIHWREAPDGEKKSMHIAAYFVVNQANGAIFIDDSHAERKEVHEVTGIPVFSPQQAIDIWLR